MTIKNKVYNATPKIWYKNLLKRLSANNPQENIAFAKIWLAYGWREAKK